jgi:hypothetical protein
MAHEMMSINAAARETKTKDKNMNSSPRSIDAEIQFNQAWQAHLEQALSQSPVVVLGIGPGRGAVHASKQIFGAGAREIEVDLIANQSGVEGVQSAFAAAASRAESVVVSGLASSLDDRAMQAVAQGVKALAEAGGKAVVVAHRDLSDMDFGAARFVGAMESEQAPELSSALRERLTHRRAAEPRPPKAPAPKAFGARSTLSELFGARFFVGFAPRKKHASCYNGALPPHEKTMPDYLIRNADQFSKFAQFMDSGAVAWGRQKIATGFPTAREAVDAFATSCRALRQEAFDSADKARQRDIAKLVAKGQAGEAASKEALRQACERRFKEGDNAGLKLPLWLAKQWDPALDALRASAFSVAQRPTQRDLLGVFDQYYVRSDLGWLSRPQTKLGTGFQWNESFAFAVQFPSAKDAQAAVGPGHGAWIIKATGAFTAVEFASSADIKSDHLTQAISAACEARDIRQGLDDAAQGRLDALDAAPARKPRAL